MIWASPEDLIGWLRQCVRRELEVGDVLDRIAFWDEELHDPLWRERSVRGDESPLVTAWSRLRDETPETLSMHDVREMLGELEAAQEPGDSVRGVLPDLPLAGELGDDGRGG